MTAMTNISNAFYTSVLFFLNSGSYCGILYIVQWWNNQDDAS